LIRVTLNKTLGDLRYFIVVSKGVIKIDYFAISIGIVKK